MTDEDHIVFIVDDDERIREALIELLASHGVRATAFGTAGEYIGADKPDAPACLILDVELPDINGLELQARIAKGEHPPIVFITGHGDIPSSVRAIKHGAVDFLTKPFSDSELMTAIAAAILQDREKRSARAELGDLTQRYLDLTPRERQVLPLVVSGLLNKQAAAELGIAVRFEGTGVDEVGVVEQVEGRETRLAAGDVIVRVDPRYFRPTEVETLLGDASKAQQKLGWKPVTTFESLVKEMVRADFQIARRDALVTLAGFKALEHHE